VLGHAATVIPSLGLVLPLNSSVERNRFAVVFFLSKSYLSSFQ